MIDLTSIEGGNGSGSMSAVKFYHYSRPLDVAPLPNMGFTALKVREQRSCGGDVNSCFNAECLLLFTNAFNNVGFASLSSFHLTRLLLLGNVLKQKINKRPGNPGQYLLRSDKPCCGMLFFGQTKIITSFDLPGLTAAIRHRGKLGCRQFHMVFYF